MNQIVDFARYRSVLLHLGFRQYRVPLPHQPQQSAWVFENREADIALSVPLLNPTDPMRLAHLMTARKIILERGLTDAETYDRLIAEGTDIPKEEMSLAKSVGNRSVA